MTSPATDFHGMFVRDFVGRVQSALDEIDPEDVAAVAGILADAHRQGRHVYLGGNGGSAATASHFAADLHAVGRGGRRLKVSVLSDGIPVLTATANDHGWAEVFADPLRGVLEPGDVVLMISASGDSENVLRALDVARERRATTILFAGCGGGAATRRADRRVILSSSDFGIIESVHASLVHLVTAVLRGRMNV